MCGLIVQQLNAEFTGPLLTGIPCGMRTDVGRCTYQDFELAMMFLSETSLLFKWIQLVSGRLNGS